MAQLTRPLAVSLALAAAAAVGLGVGLAREGSVPRTTTLAPLDVEPGLVHIHGLGVDPADGALYAATHSGLFRVPESGQAVRVANRAQDTMGFAVVGPNRFIGSGHPDSREDDVRPPLLGLVESTDAGLSWQRRSLHGEADFHVLRRAHGRTFGYDSTSSTLMVSEDGRGWDRRARLRIGDFVVSPSDPDRLVALTERGLEESRDGGRRFETTSAPEGLILLSWTSGGLRAVGVDGSLYEWQPDATWQRRGTVAAEPEAFVVDERDGREVLYVAAMGAGIVMSTDGGRTFTTRHHAQPHP